MHQPARFRVAGLERGDCSHVLDFTGRQRKVLFGRFFLIRCISLNIAILVHGKDHGQFAVAETELFYGLCA